MFKVNASPNPPSIAQEAKRPYQYKSRSKFRLQRYSPSNHTSSPIPFLQPPLARKIICTISSRRSILTISNIARRVIPHCASVIQDRWSDDVDEGVDDAHPAKFRIHSEPTALTDGDFAVEADHLAVTAKDISYCK